MFFAWVIFAFVVGALFIGYALLCVGGAIPVMSFRHVMLEPVEDREIGRFVASAFRRGSWIDSAWPSDHGFRPSGVFRALKLMGTPKIVAWQSQQPPTFLCAYFLPDGQFQIDFVTLTENGSVTTGTSKDGHLFPPRPGSLTQTFTVRTADELWGHHCAAVSFLLNLGIDRPLAVLPDFSQALEDSLRKQYAHITSIPLWFLRIPWWYFTRRSRLHGRSVQEQYESQSSVS